MNEVAPVNAIFEDHAVRYMVRENEPWWVLADVCRALEISNPRDVASRLHDDEKQVVGNTDGHSGQRGGAQSFNIINESGLYALIFRSRKPVAERFRRWVTAEVLPAIRKTGRYAVAPSSPGLVPKLPEQDAGGWNWLAREAEIFSWYVDQLVLPATQELTRQHRAKLRAFVDMVQADQPQASYAAICHYALRNPHLLDHPDVTAIRLEHDRLRLGLPPL